MYIVLEGRPDRMGANLTWYIMQIIYAHFYKYFIHSYDLTFNDSIFIKTIRIFTDNYNKKLGDKLGSHDHGPRLLNWIRSSQQDWPGNNMIVCNAIQQDLVSYFKQHLYNDFREILDNNIKQNEYYLTEIIPKKKTIGVHLRLDDVSSRQDYDGNLCTEYYRNKLNTNNININLQEEHEFGNKKGIYIPTWGREYNPYDCQAPISEYKIQSIIDKTIEKYPDYDVVIIASPKGEINLPYPCIRSDNIDQDLYYLCNCSVIICSRSLYCFVSVYLSNAIEIYIPMWGHIAGTGLTSKFDKNTNLVYW